jgi:DNA-binding MarR family transcriptional regulator
MQILVFLARVDQAAFIDVQRALALEQTRVSHAVRALKDATLVGVSPDPNDPRKRLIKPTRAGRARVRKFVRSVEPLLDAPGQD